MRAGVGDGNGDDGDVGHDGNIGDAGDAGDAGRTGTVPATGRDGRATHDWNWTRVGGRDRRGRVAQGRAEGALRARGFVVTEVRSFESGSVAKRT